MNLFRLFYLKNIYESESVSGSKALFGDDKKENDGYREFARFFNKSDNLRILPCFHREKMRMRRFKNREKSYFKICGSDFMHSFRNKAAKVAPQACVSYINEIKINWILK
ncbi:hypothetical protein [Methylobacter sp. YRD-M1]|uniref:hypothetical protein n=1 Tax=Methylobacter sp. YRD-M1 TaxID=2911520 RepID=UPI00227D1459|nr:hypothetical protein [Methylobacter sp. YRD-M1]WAK02669.1 hypothetical protein LZ558_02435 [Methylobacter sp. YRD-M1]